MKKKLLVMPLFVLVAVCVALVTGCSTGTTAEEAIRSDISSQLDRISADNDDFMKGLEKGSGDDLKQLGLDSTEYAKAYLDGFEYKIGDITVNEDKGKATAEVTVTCKSMSDIVSDFTAKYVSEAETLATASEEEATKRAGELLMETTKSAKAGDHELTFSYKQTDDGWVASDGASDQVVSAMLQS